MSGPVLSALEIADPPHRWEAIGFAGDVQPRGWTDAEVSDP